MFLLDNRVIQVVLAANAPSSVNVLSPHEEITLALARRLLTGRRQRRRRPPDAEAAEPDADTGQHRSMYARCSCVPPVLQDNLFRKGEVDCRRERLGFGFACSGLLDRRRATGIDDGMYKQRAMDHAWACPTIIARKGYPYCHIGDHGARQPADVALF
jgi:hypothetical protein